MGISVSMTYTWYDLYENDADLARIEAALDQGHGAPLPWEYFLQRQAEQLTGFSVSYTEAEWLNGALRYLCDDDAPQAQRLEFVPVLLDGNGVNLSTPNLRWRAYSTLNMAGRWNLGYSQAFRDRIIRNAARYDTDAPATSPHSRAERGIAYYTLKLLNLAEACNQAEVPAHVIW